MTKKKKTIIICTAVTAVIAAAALIFAFIIYPKYIKEPVPENGSGLTPVTRVVPQTGEPTAEAKTIMIGDGGVGIGVFNKDDKFANAAVFLSRDSLINETNIKVYNVTDKKNPVRLMIFVGTRQVKYTVDGGEAVLSTLINLPSNTYSELNVAIDGAMLPEGASAYDVNFFLERLENHAPTDDFKMLQLHSQTTYCYNNGENYEVNYFKNLAKTSDIKITEEEKKQSVQWASIVGTAVPGERYSLQLDEGRKLTSEVRSNNENPMKTFVIVNGEAITLDNGDSCYVWNGGGDKKHAFDFTVPQGDISSVYTVTFPILRPFKNTEGEYIPGNADIPFTSFNYKLK